MARSCGWRRKPKELEKAVIKMCTQAEIKEGTVKDEEDAMAGKKRQANSVTTQYNAVKEKHTAMQTSFASSEGLLQTLLTGLTGSSTQSAGRGGGFMGQLADARARLAHASAEEEQVRVKLDMSRREPGELEKRWKAVEREAGQGECDIKRMQAKVETLRKKAESTGWGE